MRSGCATAGKGASAYRDCLYRHFPDRKAREVEFFVNARRFDILRRTLGPHLQDADILNIASGPFALEFYVAPAAASIDSFDVDTALSALKDELQSRGLIGHSTFVIADVMQYEPPRRYDVIIINDLFYTKHVDFHAVIARYARHLKPGGRIYFDILDKRAGPVWTAFGKDARYRRYDMQDVRDTLRKHGLSVEATIPSMGIKGGVDGLVRRLMWKVSTIANNFIFVAKRSALVAALAFGLPELALE